MGQPQLMVQALEAARPPLPVDPNPGSGIDARVLFGTSYLAILPSTGAIINTATHTAHAIFVIVMLRIASMVVVVLCGFGPLALLGYFSEDLQVLLDITRLPPWPIVQ